MKLNRILTIILALVLTCALASPSAAAVDVDGLDFEALASGLDSPVAITHAGDARLFVTLQAGRVVIFNDGGVRPRPFLDVSERVGSGGERGLLSVAFHPEYAANGFFFVNYTDRSGDTVISRFSVTADRNVADPASEAVLLEIDQPFANHNGGQLQFGPDGFLYAGTGDGGSANDPGCRAQNGAVLLGKVLRLDVDQSVDAPPFHGIPASNPFVGDAGVADEIWALGLRNPWRFSFDRASGDLWIGDVGQNAVEEVDRQAAASGGGENYGWKMMEGTSCTRNTGGCGFAIPGCDAPEYTPPAFEYAHAAGRCSITGGYVYRSDAVPQAQGAYFYADLCTGEVWAADPATGEVALLAPRAPFLTSFGEDAAGELYLVAGGTLYRLTGPGGGGGGGGGGGDCPLEPGDPRYCSECGPCGEGEGGCRGDDQCQEGLACAEDFGELFGLPRTADVCVTPGAAPPPAYAAVALPAAGDLTVIEARAMNGAGQVVGHAASDAEDDPRTAAFRFSPRDGLEQLDPRGNLRSRGLLINAAGDVFGVIYTGNGVTRNGVFIHREGGGFDLLTRGSNGPIRQSFEAVDLNDAGDVVGSVSLGDRATPYLYLAGDGWHDLSALDERLRAGSAVPAALNEAGDVVLVLTRPGSEPGTPRRDAFLVRGGEVVALGELGGGSTLPLALNDAGRVVGAATTGAGETHAFVAEPSGALRDVHPRQFAASVALGVIAKGAAGGRITRDALPDTLFTWDPRRRQRFKVQARGPDFLDLYAERQQLFVQLGVVTVNERLEMAGGTLYVDLLGELRQGVFLFSLPHGLTNAQDLADAAGAGGEVTELIDLNDWGALLVRRADGGVVVLTPDGGAP